MEISVEQDGFIQTIESLKVRHEHYINELQPNMNKQGLLDRKSNTDEYEELLPYHVFKGAYDSVKVLIHNVQESEKGLEGKFDKLRVSCKKYFPQHQFMELEKHNKNFKRNMQLVRFRFSTHFNQLFLSD